MSHLDDLIEELQHVLAALEHDTLENALTRLDGVIVKLDAYSKPKTSARSAQRSSKTAHVPTPIVPMPAAPSAPRPRKAPQHPRAATA